MINKFVNELDIALKTLSYKKSGTDRDYPADRESNDVNLSESERKLSEALMRVNLAGEVLLKLFIEDRQWFAKILK